MAGRKRAAIEGSGAAVEFAQRLRDLRDASGMTLRQVASKSGYSTAALSMAESGRRAPSWELAEAFVQACGGAPTEWRQLWELASRGESRVDPRRAEDGTKTLADADRSPPSSSAASAPPPLTPLGALDPSVIGPFALEGRLGAGTMGQVYLGRTPGGRPVAVKVIHPALAANPHFRRRFTRELTAVRRIQGLFTACVVDADARAEQPWLATEYIPGPTLAQRVEDGGPLPEAEVIALGAGVAEALAAIHAAGIVHRDLKPSNVILAADGPKVIDFGIADTADASTLTATGSLLGRAPFMAPEFARGEGIGPGADVFSLGCLLVYALAGAPPFGQDAAAAVLYRIVHTAPDLSVLSGASERLRILIERCLVKDPAERPTAARVIAGLRPGASDKWVPVVPTGPRHGSARPHLPQLPRVPLRRRLSVIPALSVIAVVAVAALLGEQAAPSASPPAPSAPLVYSATFGPGCGLSPTNGDGDHPWNSVPGLPADKPGCAAPLYAKVSGLAPGSDGAWKAWAEWFFRPPAGTNCTLSVYVPRTTSANTPATEYNVFSDDQQNNEVGWDYVDQSTDQGTWITIRNSENGSDAYTATTGVLDLTILDAATGSTTVVADLARAACR